MWDSVHWKKWGLVAKLDPGRVLPAGGLQLIVEGGFDAVVVGGTQGVGRLNTAGLIGKVRLAGYGGPLALEISSEAAVVPGVDAYLVPVVLNAGQTRWLAGAHVDAIKKYGCLIPWNLVLAEGYLVCNPESAVGSLTDSGEVTAGEAAAYTVLAEEIFRLPVFYIEYSGRFGDMALVRSVARARKRMSLFYGGGITTTGQLEEVSGLVDTVVVGNVIHENPALARDLVDFHRCRRG